MKVESLFLAFRVHIKRKMISPFSTFITSHTKKNDFTIYKKKLTLTFLGLFYPSKYKLQCSCVDDTNLLCMHWNLASGLVSRQAIDKLHLLVKRRLESLSKVQWKNIFLIRYKSKWLCLYIVYFLHLLINQNDWSYSLISFYRVFCSIKI